MCFSLGPERITPPITPLEKEPEIEIENSNANTITKEGTRAVRISSEEIESAIGTSILQKYNYILDRIIKK